MLITPLYLIWAKGHLEPGNGVASKAQPSASVAFEPGTFQCGDGTLPTVPISPNFVGLFAGITRFVRGIELKLTLRTDVVTNVVNNVPTVKTIYKVKLGTERNHNRQGKINKTMHKLTMTMHFKFD